MSIMNVTIKVGDIEAPVSIHKAFDDKPVELNQLAPNGEPIRRINIDSNGEEVNYEDIVTGYKYADGKYVVIDKDEIKLLNLDKCSVVDIESVIGIELIDPMLFDSVYFLGLDSKADVAFATQQYSELMALVEEGRAGIGEITMRGRNHVVAVYKGHGRYLAMSTLRYPTDMRDPAFELDSLPDDDCYERGDKIFSKIGTTEFRPSQYSNHYGERMKSLIANKVAAATGITPVIEKAKV
jgi:DNA end-binding protein Ku